MNYPLLYYAIAKLSSLVLRFHAIINSLPDVTVDGFTGSSGAILKLSQAFSLDGYAEDEIVQDDTFSYKGYQVVRGEFFAHLYEPSLCFNRSKVYVNTGCLKRMQDVDYVQILVNAD